MKLLAFFGLGPVTHSRPPVEPPLRRRDLAGVFFLALAVFAAFDSGRFEGYQVETYGAAERLALAARVGGPGLSPRTRAYDELQAEYTRNIVGNLRAEVGSVPIAPGELRTGYLEPLVLVPFVWVGRVLDAAVPREGREYADAWSVSATKLGFNALAAAVVAYTAWLGSLLLARRRSALMAAAVLAIATPMLHYASLGHETGIALALTAMLAHAFGFARGIGSPSRQLALCAVAFGLVLNTKANGIAMALPLASLVALAAQRRDIGLLRRFAMFALPGLLLAGFFKLMGDAGIQAQRAPLIAKIATLEPLGVLECAWVNLASPGKSIFVFAPSLLALFALPLRAPQLAGQMRLLVALAAMPVIGTGLVAIHGYSTCQDETWGPRYLVALLPLGTTLSVSVYERLEASASRWLFRGTVALGCAMALLGALVYYGAPVESLTRAGITDIRLQVSNPLLSHPVLAVAALKSGLSRIGGSGGINYEYEGNVMLHRADGTAETRLSLDFSGFDEINLGWVRAWYALDWPFIGAGVALVVLLAGLGIGLLRGDGYSRR